MMTPFNLSKNTLNYVNFMLLYQLLPCKIAGTGALTSLRMSKNQPLIYMFVYTQKADM